jgi:hypothetical protein
MLLYIGIVLTPLLLTLGLVRILLKTDLNHYHPAWSDEVIYWQEIITFKEVGFNGGYFSIGEAIAKSDFSHFGTHGPVFAVIYGGMARLLGWSQTSGPYFNLLLVSLALLTLLLINKPDRTQSIFILLLTVFSYPVLLYLPSTMQESLIQTLAILLAAVLIRLTIGKPAGTGTKIFSIVILIVACLIKITFVFAAFPIIYLLTRRWTKKGLLISAILTILFSICMYAIFNNWTSALPDWVFAQLAGSQASLGEKIRLVFDHSVQNLVRYFSIPGSDLVIEVIFRYQYLAVMLICILALRKHKTLMVSVLFLLGAIFAAMIMVYDVKWFRDYRTLAPMLMIAMYSLAFCANSTKIKRYMAIFLFSNAITIWIFCVAYREMHLKQFVAEWDPAMKVYSEPFSRMEYTPEADPWCNSILSLLPSKENIGSIQPGLGVNLLLDPQVKMEVIRSHYLFVPKEFLVRQGLEDSCATIFEADGKILCERVDDACP